MELQGTPEVLFSMTEGLSSMTNLLGAGDPAVHWIDGRWWMFFGAFQTSLRNNIFAATLRHGESLRGKNQWHVCTQPNSSRRAHPLVPQPGRNAWDRYGLHEPSFAEGTGTGSNASQVRRIYYAGRSSRSPVGNTSPYSIGVLELTPAGWYRHPEPVVTGTERNPSALGPKVIYADGKWRMWFRASPGEPAKGDPPLAEIQYTESENGLTDWSTPKQFYSREEGFAHAFVQHTPRGYEMLLSKTPNLFGEDTYPEQKLWITRAGHASGDVTDWSAPMPVLDAAAGPSWYRGGFTGSSLVYERGSSVDAGERFIFFTGVHTPISWPRTALQRLRSGRRPPVPAPFYFTIAKAHATVGTEATVG